MMGERETVATTLPAETPAAAPTAPVARAVWKAWGIGFAGWLVPGLGHLALKKFDRAAVFFVSITALAAMGLAMHGKVYEFGFDRTQELFAAVLQVFAFIADLGTGSLYLAARWAGVGEGDLSRALGDYGSTYFWCAGLLNVLTALDAYDIAVGKKD